MAFRLSTGLINAMMDQKAAATDLMTATTISFEDGTGASGRDRIADSGSGLAGFTPGDKVTVEGSTSNDGTYEILAVATTYLEVAAASLTTEAAGDQVVLAAANGGAFVDLFRNCIIDIYSGSQPSDADQAETGTKLVRITLSGGAFNAGSPDNGLNFGEVVAGVIAQESGETWQGDGLAAGTAGWARCYDNSVTTGASTTSIRFDMAVATSGAQLNMSNTTVTVGGTSTVDSVAITLPDAAS